ILAQGVEGNRVDAAERGLGCRPAIAGVPFLAGPGKGSDFSAPRIISANAVVPSVGEIDRSIRPDRQAVHAVEGSVSCQPTVAIASFLIGAANSCEHALRVDLQDPPAGQFD